MAKKWVRRRGEPGRVEPEQHRQADKKELEDAEFCELARRVNMLREAMRGHEAGHDVPWQAIHEAALRHVAGQEPTAMQAILVNSLLANMNRSLASHLLTNPPWSSPPPHSRPLFEDETSHAHVCPSCNRKLVEDETRAAVADELIDRVVQALADGTMSQQAAREVLKLVMAQRIERHVDGLTRRVERNIADRVRRGLAEQKRLFEE